jgi:hypothetical protein
MTLIVARTIDGSVRILSDWKVTHEDPRRSGPLHGAPKALALSSHLAVAYSGTNYYYALEQIRRSARKSSGMVAEDVAQALARISSDGQHDFIVASCSQIHLVREGTIQFDLPTAWLGDFDAFEAYQRAYHEALPLELPPVGPFSSAYFTTVLRMAQAFDFVLTDDRLHSVGGFLISLTSRSSRGHGFHYLPHTYSDESAKGARGTYNYSLLVPREIGVAAIGIHFREGEFGALFRPLEDVMVERIPAPTVRDFLLEVERHFGLRLEGPFVDGPRGY